MKNSIDAFLEAKKVAILGVSPRKDNWGKALMAEFLKHDYEVIPVNPKHDEIDGVKCYPTVKDLPADIENVVIAVRPEIADDLTDDFTHSTIKRVWFQRGMGKGSYSEPSARILKEKGIDVIYGFCPMMFIGEGMHKFHFWLRRNFSKTPEEFSMN